jgi:hypothetical protein
MLYLLAAAFMGRNSCNNLELRCCTEPAPSILAITPWVLTLGILFLSKVLDFKTLSWSKLEAKSQAEPSESAGAVPFSACAGHSVVITKSSFHSSLRELANFILIG